MKRVEMLLAAASASSAGTLDLIEAAREEIAGRPVIDASFSVMETIENLADALKLALEASGRTDPEATQLVGAVSKYLECWA